MLVLRINSDMHMKPLGYQPPCGQFKNQFDISTSVPQKKLLEWEDIDQYLMFVVSMKSPQ